MFMQIFSEWICKYQKSPVEGGAMGGDTMQVFGAFHNV